MHVAKVVTACARDVSVLLVYLEALYGNLFSLRHHAASPCAAQA